MVISPQHLVQQWVAEARKFCPSLKVVLLDAESENPAQLVVPRERIQEADLFVTTLYTILFYENMNDGN